LVLRVSQAPAAGQFAPAQLTERLQSWSHQQVARVYDWEAIPREASGLKIEVTSTIDVN
jgi:hypothetical protein